MKLRSTLAITALLLTSLVSIPASQAASCNQVNQVRVTNGVKYVCKKVGSKLEWTKQRSAAVAAPAVTPRATPKPRATPDPKSSPSPTSKAIEWANCSKLASTIGKGSKGLICLLYQGQPTWVSNAVLDDHYPFMPCRRAGATSYWEGVLLRCVNESGGNLWDPIYDNDSKPPANSAKNFTLTHTACHWSSLNPIVERLNGGIWEYVATARFAARNSSCPTNTAGLEANLTAVEGSEVRFKISTSRWTWYSTTVILGSSSNITWSTGLPVVITPLTSTIQVVTNQAGAWPSDYKLISYTENGDLSTFVFQLGNMERSFFWNGISSVSVNGALIPSANVSFSPASPASIFPGGTFSLILKRGSFQWDPMQLQFDQAGSIASFPFSQRVTVSFSWR